MTDEEKKKKQEKSWIEEFLYNVMREITRQVMNQFFDEVIGWHYNYIDWDQGVVDYDEIEDWDF